MYKNYNLFVVIDKGVARMKNVKRTSHKNSLRTVVKPYKNNLSESNNQARTFQRGKNSDFGDHLVEKDPDTIRIVSQNVNCIGISNELNQKQEHAKDWIFQHSVDIIG